MSPGSIKQANEMTSKRTRSSRFNATAGLSGLAAQAENRARSFVVSQPKLFELALRARAMMRGETEVIRGELAPTQIYRGYSLAQAAMLRSMVGRRASRELDRIVDGFGQQTLLECIPFASTFDLDRLSVPIPDDGYHAEAAEYIAVADSVARARSQYCVAELGAGWGPWVGFGGVLARSRGLADITVIAVEAHPGRFELLQKHLAANSLRGSDAGVTCRLFNGAATVTRCEAFFPDVDVAAMGPAVSESEHSVDHRGIDQPKIRVEGYPLTEILGESQVDLLHIDVQGTEFELVEANLELLERQVRAMMIGTHSRTIEGKLIELLYSHGWQLELEKPCRVVWKVRSSSREPVTETDGCQYWRKAD
jgi:FkbM family methyltransferase